MKRTRAPILIAVAAVCLSLAGTAWAAPKSSTVTSVRRDSLATKASTALQPPDPGPLTATAQAGKTQLSWPNSGKGETGWAVEARLGDSGNFNKVAQVRGGQYVYGYARCDYAFRVRSLRKLKAFTQYGNYSNVAKADNAPPGVPGKPTCGGGNALVWAPATCADGYVVEGHIAIQNPPFQQLAETSGTSWPCPGFTTYKWRIKAFRNAGGAKVYSLPSSIGGCNCGP
jgi:hypothetical protein